jgi:hypothetical protein
MTDNTDPEAEARNFLEQFTNPLAAEVKGSDEDWEIISTYSRKQAIADGVLVDLMQGDLAKLVHEAGWKFPIAMTNGAWCETVGSEPLPSGQSITGRLWDVLNVMRFASKQQTKSSDRIHFEVSVWDGERHNTVQLWALCAPGDTPEPVITIMLQGED